MSDGRGPFAAAVRVVRVVEEARAAGRGGRFAGPGPGPCACEGAT